jgi:signal transduction histidine kinase
MPPDYATAGLRAAQAIREQLPEIAILVLSAYVEVEDVVLQAVDAVGETADGRLDVRLDESASDHIDPHEVGHALVNLIENALRHSPATEQVLVETRTKSSEALVRIVDRGPGAEKGELDRIFEPFRRGSQGGDTLG